MLHTSSKGRARAGQGAILSGPKFKKGGRKFAPPKMGAKAPEFWKMVGMPNLTLPSLPPQWGQKPRRILSFGLYV